MIVNTICVFPILLIASIDDLYQYRVPNTVILCGLILGLLTQCYTKGWTGILIWMMGSLVPFFLCFVLYLFRMLGAADIKLFSMIGSVYGLSFAICVIVVSFLVGAVWSVIQMIHYHNARERWKYFLNYVRKVRSMRRRLPYCEALSDKRDESIPFAICISIGVLFCALQYSG